MSQKWGTVYLGGIQLDIDPDNYKIIEGKRRGSVHQLITPSTVTSTMTFVQDFGVDVGDYVITISGVIFSQTMSQLMTLYRKTNYSFTVTDFMYNNIVAQFYPGEVSYTATPIPGSQDAFTYNIKLVVIGWNTFENVSGSGGSFPATS